MNSKQAVECCGAIWPEVATLIQRQEKLLIKAMEREYNSFEPDNQSMFYKELECFLETKEAAK